MRKRGFFMEKSKIENDFISWCQYIHPDINPYLFFRRHMRYSDEYAPFLEELMVNLHEELSTRCPNINFSFKGRIKSKRSFLIKTFRTMAENIEKLFPDQYPTNESEQKELQEERSKNIDYYLKFLVNAKPPKVERYLKLKNIIESAPLEKGTLKNFKDFFDELTPEEKESLVIRLGRTEDTFANRIIVNDVDFNIQSIKSNSDGQLEILDEKGNAIPISSSRQIPADEITLDETDGNRYAIIDGKRKRIYSHNLLYNNELSAKDRTFANASKTSDGKITLFQDMLVIDDNEQFDVVSTFTDSKTGDTMVITHQPKEVSASPYCEDNTNILNLSKLLRNGTNVKLKKFDSEYTEKALYDIRDAMYQYYDEKGITRIWRRSKDYVKDPKEESNYKSLHDSFFYEEIGYCLETQIRDLEMAKDCENKPTTNSTNTHLATSHDTYKKEKMKKWYKNPILRHILEKDPEAFDSSTEILEKLLYNPDVALPDLLGKYIITAKVGKNKVESFAAKIHQIFEHTFRNPKAYIPDANDTLPPLDFSSYKNFLKSMKKRNDARSNGNFNIDLDYI